MNIDEHAPRVKDTSNKQYEPTHEEETLIKRCNQLLKKAKEHREKYDKDWIEDYLMFRGKQWPTERPPYRHSEVINMIFQNIQSMIPILTDSRPKIEFLPSTPDDQFVTKILNNITRDDWEKNSWLTVTTEALYDGHFYGVAYTETGYDPELKNGLGNATYKTVDPLFCYPDPESTDVNVNSEHFIVTEPMTLNKIKKKWPTNGKFVRADIDDFISDEKADYGKIKYKSPTDNVVAYEGTSMQRGGGSDKALVVTVWLKDDEIITEQSDEKNEKGEMVQKEIRKLKYPKGRKVVYANNILLQDGPNPYDDGEFPYERYSNYILPREFFGMSEISQLKSPQRIFNKMVSFALDVLTLMGNPIWIMDGNAGIDPSNIFNSPGLILQKNPGSEVRRETGVQLQPYVLQLIDRMKTWFDDISGSNDVSRGATPASINTGIAIQTLQDAAFTRLRQKSRNLDAMLQKMGQHYLSRILQFYKAPRVIRLTNENDAVNYFKISVEEGEANGKRYKDMIVVPYNKDKEGEQLRYNLLRDFDVRVQTGSSLPFARAEKEAKLLQYYDRGIIDREEVLKNAEIPNWEAIHQRITEKEEAAAQQAATQQAAT